MHPSSNSFTNQHRGRPSHQPSGAGGPSRFNGPSWQSTRQGGPNTFNEPSRQSFQTSRQGSRYIRTRTSTTAPSAQQGMTTIIRAGEPHEHGVRVDYQNIKVHGNLCRCQNPNSHGDAFACTNLESYDRSGQPMSWSVLMNRVLDHYGTDSVPRERLLPAYRQICDPDWVKYIEKGEADMLAGIAEGEPLEFNPLADVTHHNGDGHRQNFVGEQGLQTRMPGPSGASRGGRGGGFRGTFGSRR